MRTIKLRVVASTLERYGHELVRQRGRHRQSRHRATGDRITVSGKAKDDMTRGQLADLGGKTGLELR
jgi:predicted RNA binding protein YcfA (HicA-like mRNA interferase family)